MNIRAKLDARLSRFSPTTVYVVGLIDGAILVSAAVFLGYLVSKVTH